MSLGLQDFDKKNDILVHLKNTASHTKQGGGQNSSLFSCLMDSRKVSKRKEIPRGLFPVNFQVFNVMACPGPSLWFMVVVMYI
jgi:hypothetical protein